MIQLQRLNLDTSLFLEIGGFKVLIDPWLEGTEVDFFSWFNTQWHRTAPMSYDQLPDFDSVLITQKYPDHFHLQTLKKLSPSHIVAPRSLEKKIRKNLPETSLTLVDAGNSQIRFGNVQIVYLPTRRKVDPIYDAFVLDDGKESVFLATHGYQFDDQSRSLVQEASPCQLLVTPFNRYELPFFLGGTVSPGLDGVEHLCEILKPKKVMAVHDEDKHAKGLVSKLARITRPTSTQALREIPWLGDRYFELNHYQRIEIS